MSDALVDVVDGALDPAARATVEAHLSGCEACRALVADLRRVRQQARTLAPLEAPAGAWERLAARLETEGVIQAVPAGAAGSGTPNWRWLAAAAVLLLVAGTALRLGQRPEPASPVRELAGASTPTALIDSVEAELRLAVEHYDRAIAGMEQVAALDPEADGVGAEQGLLDPDVTATLQKNLEVIDQAIAESRAAVRAEPQNQVAQDSLFAVMWRKVALLQDTIVLMNEMRKGNQAEAARIVESLNRE